VRALNWDHIKGNWKQLKGKVQEKWGKLPNDHIDVVAGKRERLAGNIQEVYGIGKAEVNRQIDEFADSAHEVGNSELRKTPKRRQEVDLPYFDSLLNAGRFFSSPGHCD